MNTEQLRSQLGYKQRTVNELVRFIDTRNETSASYSIFLGAGASVSSGIRTAIQLVEEWRKEQYYKLNSEANGEYNAETAREWLAKQQASWYNPNKEYSCLFERAFDLPRQRRIFVEREVSKGFPSLGYAYLVRLIEKNYFDTVFTTNFDDLINEAFHQFSNVRPIVCAHDSSISSVTFTSKRPKIIKLHGDYLFDDIKSTMRETETLEKNTREKFIELSKELGLIVIGYSGSDRSVMDVVDFLLKNESYLKNGVYWCIRKGDKIGDDLLKLLWKERVYWVETSGFDELFAELYSSLCGKELPINTSLFNERTTRIFENYLGENNLRGSESEIVQFHIAKLEKEKNSNILADLFKSLATEDDEKIPEASFTDEDVQILLQVQKLEKERKFQEVVSFAMEKASIATDPDLKIRLLNDAFDSARKTHNLSQAVQICEQLIELEPKNPKYYRYKALVTGDFDEKIEILNVAINKNPFQATSFIRKAKVISAKIEALVGTERDSAKKEMRECIEKAIELDPSFENEAWELKFNDIKLQESEGRRDKELLNIIETLQKQSPHSPEVCNLILEFCKHKNTRVFQGKDVINLISESKDLFFPDNNVDNCLILIEAYNYFKEKELLETFFAEAENISKLKRSNRFILSKASSIADLLCDMPLAIETIKNHQNFERYTPLVSYLIQLLIDSEQFEEAEQTLEKYSNQLSEEEIISKKAHLFEMQDRIPEAINFYNKIKKNKYNEHKIIAGLSYLYLREKNYKKTRELTNSFLSKIAFNFEHDTLILNYEFASFKLNHKINKNRISALLQKASYKPSIAVCNLLLENKATALEIIKDYFTTNFQSSLQMTKWPILESVQGEVIKMRNDLKKNG